MTPINTESGDEGPVLVIDDADSISNDLEFNKRILSSSTSEERTSTGLKTKVLTKELIQTGLSRLSKVGFSAVLDYTVLKLPNRLISRLGDIAAFKNLQEIDLSYNYIEDIDEICSLNYLAKLNFNTNKVRHLNKLQNSECLASLRCLNFSKNEIEELPVFEGHVSIINLQMAHNHLTTMSGIENCSYMYTLDFSGNRITTITGLDNMTHLRKLDLSNNLITEVSNLENLKALQYLDLGNNKITALEGLCNLSSLETLKVNNNRIQHLTSVLVLSGLKFLADLDMRHNMVVQREGFKPATFYLCTNLKRLNDEEVSDHDWLAAKDAFTMNPISRGVRNHFKDIVLKINSFEFGSQILEDTPEWGNKTYTLIALLGPVGCGKETMAGRLARKYPHLVRHIKTLVCPLTSQNPAEIVVPSNTEVYERISEKDFFNLITENKLLLTFARRGCAFGIRSSDVDKAARDNLASVMCLNTAGVVDLIGSLIKPISISFMPQNIDLLRSTAVKVGYDDINLKRIEDGAFKHKGVTKEYSGFFSGEIQTDDLDEAFENFEGLLHAFGLNPNGDVGSWKWRNWKNDAEGFEQFHRTKKIEVNKPKEKEVKRKHMPSKRIREITISEMRKNVKFSKAQKHEMLYRLLRSCDKTKNDSARTTDSLTLPSLESLMAIPTSYHEKILAEVVGKDSEFPDIDQDSQRKASLVESPTVMRFKIPTTVEDEVFLRKLENQIGKDILLSYSEKRNDLFRESMLKNYRATSSDVLKVDTKQLAKNQPLKPAQQISTNMTNKRVDANLPYSSDKKARVKADSKFATPALEDCMLWEDRKKLLKINAEFQRILLNYACVKDRRESETKLDAIHALPELSSNLEIHNDTQLDAPGRKFEIYRRRLESWRRYANQKDYSSWNVESPLDIVTPPTKYKRVIKEAKTSMKEKHLPILPASQKQRQFVIRQLKSLRNRTNIHNTSQGQHIKNTTREKTIITDK